MSGLGLHLEKSFFKDFLGLLMQSMWQSYGTLKGQKWLDEFIHKAGQECFLSQTKTGSLTKLNVYLGTYCEVSAVSYVKKLEIIALLCACSRKLVHQFIAYFSGD